MAQVARGAKVKKGEGFLEVETDKVNVEIEAPDDGVLAIGSGGSYALAAARALAKHTDLSARDIAVEALHIAGEICIYSNHQIVVEEL